MKLGQFLSDYLKDFARITIEERGSIIYLGDVISLPRELKRGMKVVKIEGLGSENDLIITVESEQGRK